MKTHAGLIEKIAGFPNLLAASRKARLSKRYRPDVLAFEARLEENLVGLRRKLLDGSYIPGPYRNFRIRDPKPRLVSAPCYRDRVVHHAVIAVIEPLFDRGFVHESFACRVGKGTHKALDSLTSLLRGVGEEGFAFQADISRYFPSIDHEILKSLLRRRIRCRRTLGLLDRIIDTSPPQDPVYALFPGDDLFSPLARRKGLPIGALTSQLFANLYLDPLDHFVKERLRCKRYVRYMDDFLILDEDRDRLVEARDAIEEFLFGLRLRLKPSRTRVFPVREGIDFLGFRVWKDRRRLRRAAVVRIRRRLGEIVDAVAAGEMAKEKASESWRAWCAHAAHGNTVALRRDLIQTARLRLRGRAQTGACGPRRRLQQQPGQPPGGEPQTEHAR